MLGALIDTLKTGGPIVFVLLALSVVSLTLILVKIVQLWPVLSGARLRGAAFEQWTNGDFDAAVRTIAAGRSPADRVLTYAMQSLQAGFRGAPLDAELTRLGNHEMAAMNRHIRVLELIAMVSPLLGLLGTVLGMIQSFQELELAQGAANASVLAGGIWQALLTTAAGLLVAIPAAIAATLLSARIDMALHLIESAVGELMLIDARKTPKSATG